MSSKALSLTLVGVVGLTAIGCGGSSGGGSPEPTATATPTPTATATPTPVVDVCDETFVECSGTDAIISGTVDKDLELSGDFNWFIDGFVFVGGGASEVTSEAQVSELKNNRVTITIPAGTDVKAFDDGALIVTRGGKIMAEGTANNPITFSSLDDNFDGIGEWGGVVIQGWAQQFGLGGTGVCHGGSQTYCNVVGEGDAGFYGGDDDADNSGVFKYVRIAEGGLVAGPDSEINGLTLQGVGHATVVEYVQVHNNQDDGVEWFGGTVNAKYLFLTGNDDDAIDYDQGWRGNVQYAVVLQGANLQVDGNDPRGIEANSSDDEYVPETEGVLANITLVGGAANDTGDPGMRLRGALTTSIYNTAIIGFESECVRIDDADTDGNGNIAFSDVFLQNVIGKDCAVFFDHEAPTNTQGSVGKFSFDIDSNYALTPDEMPVRRGGGVAIQAVDNGSGFSFDATNYVGAVEPGGNVWWQGWTIAP